MLVIRSIKAFMELNNIIQYAIIFLMPLFLIGCHNWTFKSEPSNDWYFSKIGIIYHFACPIGKKYELACYHQQ